MGKLVMSLRIEREIKDILQGLADKEGRSLSSYLEQIILMMRDRELLKEKNALDVCADWFSMLANKMDVLILQTAGKKVKEKSGDTQRQKEQLERVLQLELPESLPAEVWKRWVIHLRTRKGNRLDVERATAILERWARADANGYDLEDLVEVAMQRNYADAVFESHLEPREVEKPWWHDAK